MYAVKHGQIPEKMVIDILLYPVGRKIRIDCIHHDRIQVRTGRRDRQLGVGHAFGQLVIHGPYGRRYLETDGIDIRILLQPQSDLSASLAADRDYPFDSPYRRHIPFNLGCHLALDDLRRSVLPVEVYRQALLLVPGQILQIERRDQRDADRHQHCEYQQD